jgi:ATP-dependent exoDNAse (exonuclease V) beta subunit
MDDLGAEADDPVTLQRAAQRLSAEDSGAQTLEIMTIHKAKGLEFDHVVLPFLDRGTRPSEPPMLLWRREGGGLLMAGRQARDLYRWLAREDRARDAHERERLLYVACTRARQSLHLFAEVDDHPAADSLLAVMWPHLAAPAQWPQQLPAADDSPDYAAAPALTADRPVRLRLPADYRWQPPAGDLPAGAPVSLPTGDLVSLTHLPEVAFGTLMHEVLRHLSLEALPADADAYCRERQELWRETLDGFGVDKAAQGGVLARLRQQLGRVLADPDGRRILAARHGAHSELALSGIGTDGVSNIFIDRTFVDDQRVRWIIDYKTGTPPRIVTPAAFVAAETTRHTPQLRRYASLAAAVYPEPIRLALYFTALPLLAILDAEG